MKLRGRHCRFDSPSQAQSTPGRRVIVSQPVDDFDGAVKRREKISRVGYMSARLSLCADELQQAHKKRTPITRCPFLVSHHTVIDRRSVLLVWKGAVNDMNRSHQQIRKSGGRRWKKCEQFSPPAKPVDFPNVFGQFRANFAVPAEPNRQPTERLWRPSESAAERSPSQDRLRSWRKRPPF